MSIKSSKSQQGATNKRTLTPRIKSVKVNFEPQTEKQSEFLRKIHSSVVSFGIGFPGTGKTLIAVAYALQMLLDGKIEKIIITRPTISSGPEIGFLPGSEADKLSVFLVPIFDAINKLIPEILANQLFDDEKIEIGTISFARGRNFENAVVIVDESENLDKKSFYLLLTRICEGSKMIFTGDSGQIDLKNPKDSGLQDAILKFQNKEDFSITEFGIEDCRRSRVVKEVIKAYYPELI